MHSRAGRYRYFSTPILLAQASQTPPTRRYAHAVVQKPRGAPSTTPWPLVGPSVWPRPPKPTLAQKNDEVDHFAALMEKSSLSPSAPDDWARSLTTSSKVVEAPTHLPPRYPKSATTPIRSKKRNQNGSLANSAAEIPLLQEEEDFEDSLAGDPESEDAQSSRFDWRTRAISRLSPQQADRWLQRNRKFRFKPGIPQVAEGEPFASEIKDYSSRYLPLIHLEQLASDAVLKQRIEEWSAERLVQEGYRIGGLGGFWQTATFFGRPVAVLALGPGTKFEWHRFERGHQVQLSASSQGEEKLEPYLGTVVDVSDTAMKVTFDEKFELDSFDQLDLWSSDIATQRMVEAIRMLNVDLASTNGGSPLYERREAIMQGTLLRDVLLKEFQATAETQGDQHRELAITQPGAFSENHMIQSWAQRHVQSNPITVPGDPVLKDLNESQVKAMAMMIGNKISLIQGPPGTGKTRTIAETVKILKAHFQVPQPILICTYTNVAVDNLLEALLAAGVKPLRVASPGKVKESLAQYSLEAKMEEHPQKPEYDDTMRELERLRQLRDEMSDKCKTLLKSDSPKALKAKAKYELIQKLIKGRESASYKIRMTMLHEITHSADVICTTCISSASVGLNVIDFPVVFLDEASMCMEPASLIPVMKGCQHLALIGDHQQLPPIITSPEALEGGLGVSLFERLINEGNVPTVMLDQQYRMHPDISAFPAKEFYDGTLRDGVVDSKGQVDGRLGPPKSKHLEAVALSDPGTESLLVPSTVFVHHSGGENKRDKSRINETEAKIVCELIEDLLAQNPNLRGENIGVIAPYAAQITLLGRLLQTNSEPHQRFVKSLGEYRAAETASIEVKTVDGFEGREKEVIIFSTVRSNTAGYIGFLADRRRLNVGLTRAKRALFVVGNAKTLRTGRVGHVEGAGLAAAKAGAGAKNIKFDIAVDIAAEVADPSNPPKMNSAASSQAVVTKLPTTRHRSGGIWSRYLEWLDGRGLIYDWVNNRKLL
ncbi:hypothetical protein FRB90_002261 [Tulasnella sp. 427]|nr:hypothetical protein FRB90_002261 [Tulasnella sp. 427]